MPLASPRPLPPAGEQLVTHWDVRPGQYWHLGPHRVGCGNATNMRDVGHLFAGEQWRCLCTSPPYLSRRHYQSPVGDWQRLAIRFMETAMLYSQPTSDCLVNLGLVHADRAVVRYWEPWLTACAARGWPLFGWYVWDKLTGFPGDHAGRLASAHEWLFHFQQGDTQARAWLPTQRRDLATRTTRTVRQPDGSLRPFSSPGRVSKVPDSVIRAPRNMRRGLHTRLHPATQAQEFVACIVLTWSAPGDLVYDPFGGSGQTLLTCHALGRRCVTLDIAPLYVATMLQRWYEITGERPARYT